MRKITLRFFEDDASGQWGVAPEACIGTECSFNAFWNGTGIFHDVWEHYFEFEHKYFRGDYGCTIAGEVAATGHALWYNNSLGIANRGIVNRTGEIWLDIHELVAQTKWMFEEAISDGYIRYGYDFSIKVPRQRRNVDYEIESLIDAHVESIKSMKVLSSGEDSLYAIEFKKGCTKGKIAMLLRWGYKQAKRLVPFTPRNSQTLIDFIKHWDAFCKEIPAKQLALEFRGIEFMIRGGPSAQWQATFITTEGKRWSRQRAETFIHSELIC